MADELYYFWDKRVGSPALKPLGRGKNLPPIAKPGLSLAQKRGLTPYRMCKPAFKSQWGRGLSPFLGKAPGPFAVPESRGNSTLGRLRSVLNVG